MCCRAMQINVRDGVKACAFEPWPWGFLLVVWVPCALMSCCNVMHVAGREIRKRKRRENKWRICLIHLSYVVVPPQSSRSTCAQGRVHPCKDDFGINEYQAQHPDEYFMIPFHSVCLSLWQSSHRKTLINYSRLPNRLIKIYRKRRIAGHLVIQDKRVFDIFCCHN